MALETGASLQNEQNLNSYANDIDIGLTACRLPVHIMVRVCDSPELSACSNSTLSKTAELNNLLHNPHILPVHSDILSDKKT